MLRAIPTICGVLFSLVGSAYGQTFSADMKPLIESACIGCHDADTTTGLNFQSISHDLSDAKAFRIWESVFDRIESGEMPPSSEDRPNKKQLSQGLRALRKDLFAANVARQQRVGRVPARRLTKRELGFTLRDLLHIDADVTVGIPDEVEAGTFSQVGEHQRISDVHMESYLKAAEAALATAIQLGSKPFQDREVDFSHLEEWHDKPINQGGSITRQLNDGEFEVDGGVALFRDVDYLTSFQFQPTVPGRYEVIAHVAAYQSADVVTAKVIAKEPSGGARLLKAVDLNPGEDRVVKFEAVLKPFDNPYLTFDMNGVEPFTALANSGGSKFFKGRGLAILSQKIRGPLTDSWPPPSTKRLLGSDFDAHELGAANYDSKMEFVKARVTRMAPRIFRRPVSEQELQPFVALAKPAARNGAEVADAIRIPLSSMLTSPQFLMMSGQAGSLTDYELASRLSYFLWSSLPDDELFELAEKGRLTQSAVLKKQVDRMLADRRSMRFVEDFTGQWLRLNKLNITTPDDGLYPEFDELLGASIPQETRLFFAHVLNENLSLRTLIDADFTFLNRRLADHYQIEGVAGQEFRKVDLPADSIRGGILTQAAILKTTANGTTTSPVTRGNFVLTSLLGTPPSPPPADVGSIEPDTRGTTTIRAILDKHRDIESCNQCHKEIDPPGFALECFDPIGGFRTHYRANGGEYKYGDYVQKLPPKEGPPVDAAGVTPDGQAFAGIDDFRKILLQQDEQIARHFISQLVVYSTGAEIQFADRDTIEQLVSAAKQNDYRMRDLIHAVVASKLFLNK